METEEWGEEDVEVGENAELLEMEKTPRRESMPSIGSHLYELADMLEDNARFADQLFADLAILKTASAIDLQEKFKNKENRFNSSASTNSLEFCQSHVYPHVLGHRLAFAKIARNNNPATKILNPGLFFLISLIIYLLPFPPTPFRPSHASTIDVPALLYFLSILIIIYCYYLPLSFQHQVSRQTEWTNKCSRSFGETWEIATRGNECERLPRSEQGTQA
jgi:hypothetical protein